MPLRVVAAFVALMLVGCQDSSICSDNEWAEARRKGEVSAEFRDCVDRLSGGGDA